MPSQFPQLNQAVDKEFTSYDELTHMVEECLRIAQRPFDGSSLYRETLQIAKLLDLMDAPEPFLRYAKALNSYVNYRGSRDYSVREAKKLDIAIKELCSWFLSDYVYASDEAAETHLALTYIPSICRIRGIE